MSLEALLSGREIDHDHYFHPALQYFSAGRNELLKRICLNQRVVHVGFADHLDLIPMRRQEGTWLHDIVSRSAKQLIGLDVNENAVNFLTAQGVKNLYCCDVFGLEVEAIATQYPSDVILLPDVIEHVPDPVAFINRLSVVFEGARLVVSVPNYLSYRSLLSAAASGAERINTDHRFWFSPYTLTKNVWLGGFHVTRLHAAPLGAARSLKGTLAALVLGWRPMFAECLIAEALPRQTNADENIA